MRRSAPRKSLRILKEKPSGKRNGTREAIELLEPASSGFRGEIEAGNHLPRNTASFAASAVQKRRRVTFLICYSVFLCTVSTLFFFPAVFFFLALLQTFVS